MKKRDARTGQVVEVKHHELLATVCYVTKMGVMLRFPGGVTKATTADQLTLAVDVDAECHGCNCTGTLHLRNGNVLECHNCGATSQLAASKTKPVSISAAALELGNLATLYLELRREEADHDHMHGMAKANAQRATTKADRAESEASASYMDGAAFGFMRSRQHIEGLMANLGLEDPYQVEHVPFNATNANAR